MNISDRLQAWFTPQIPLASTELISSRLEELANEYDKGIGTNMTVGKMREIFDESDKLQAELWRRHVHGEL